MKKVLAGVLIDYEINETIEFAIDELFRYAGKVGAKINFDRVSLGVSDEFMCKKQIDRDCLRFDGYILQAVGGELIIASLLPRGILYGVYTLLEENGCRFIRAGGMNERIYFHENEIAFDGCKIYNPDFEIRSITNCLNAMGESVYLETLDIVDWCAKNRINTFFLHEDVQQADNPFNRQLGEQIFKREMRYEFGGHGAQNFVDKELFATQPELFIEKNGVRNSAGNFCVSNEKSGKLFVDSVLKLMRSNPNITVLHLWFDDVLDGSWCRCSECRDLTPVEQTKKMVALAAEALREEFPLLEFDILLYHDTIKNQAKGALPKNCIAYWAPRERCYAHAINDPTCSLNTKYMLLLEEAIENYGIENICVFEYYMDFILFSKVKTNIADVIAEDLKFYKRRGINRCTSLGFGYYSFWAYELNNFVYARHLFNTELNAQETTDIFLKYMGLTESFSEYYALLSKFSKLYFAFCGYGLEFCDIRRVSLCEYTREHIAKMKEAKSMLIAAQKLLSGTETESQTLEFVKYEKKLLELSLIEVDGIIMRTQLRYNNFIGNFGGVDLSDADAAKRCLIREIDFISTIPLHIKGNNGKDNFIKNLCRTQIWTVNEFLFQEFGINLDLDMSKIMEGIYDVELA